MTSSPEPLPGARRLRATIALGTTEDGCTVVADDGQRVVPYALTFPRPRVGRVAPGNLVAIAIEADGSEVVVWRWFDAVVIAAAGLSLTLWEPGHGIVDAQPRDPRHGHIPGGRAYLSAGLPGAEWWVAGPAVDRAASADVELDEVQDFLTSNGLWDRLT